jgi:hypothetical protein
MIVESTSIDWGQSEAGRPLPAIRVQLVDAALP